MPPESEPRTCDTTHISFVTKLSRHHLYTSHKYGGSEASADHAHLSIGGDAAIWHTRPWRAARREDLSRRPSTTRRISDKPPARWSTHRTWRRHGLEWDLRSHRRRL